MYLLTERNKGLTIFQHILQYRFGVWPSIWNTSFLKLSRPKIEYFWKRGQGQKILPGRMGRIATCMNIIQNPFLDRIWNIEETQILEVHSNWSKKLLRNATYVLHLHILILAVSICLHGWKQELCLCFMNYLGMSYYVADLINTIAFWRKKGFEKYSYILPCSPSVQGEFFVPGPFLNKIWWMPDFLQIM